MTDLFSNAAEIMLVGMGAVLAFLLLLIAAMMLMAKVIPHPEPTTSRQSATAQGSTTTGDNVSPKVVAAISAAVHSYRSTNQNNKK